MTLMLCYGIILIIVIRQGFNKILEHESRLSRFMRNIDELEDLVNDVNTEEPKDIIKYRIGKIKAFINRFRHG